jgi:dipeptidyl aminopeptidase/acylaminoacyl peptidase
MVNYTGSLGFGQDWVEALLGRVGELDVGDVFASAKYLVEIGIAEEGKGKQFVSGGSHGGFLCAHCECLPIVRGAHSPRNILFLVIGQYRDFFAAVMRNPEINIGSSFATSDIPDWGMVECGIPYSPETVVTPVLYKRLYEASPIAHIANVRAPVLLFIGDADLRVPTSQGRDYYHALKARGKEVEMLWFPENNHALDKVEAERVSWEAQWEWFEKRKVT